MNDAPRFLTIPEAASAARISRATLYNHAAGGRVRIIKLGRRSLIATDEFERWIASLPAKDDDQAS